MEDFVKGSFLSVISFFVIACLLIVGLPWLWNWIVFIFQSPLPAGQASKVYLIDSFMECLPFILTTMLILLSLDIVINRRYENTTEYEVEAFLGSKVYVPTLQVVSSEKTATEPKEEAKTPDSTQSRGEEVTVHIPTQNGGKYLYVIKDSLEHKQALALARSEMERLKELEQSDHETNLKNIFLSKKGCKVE